jgi:histidinol-phosphate/aromatic aminotransferase/cobyric acid decarboxylase-like protein
VKLPFALNPALEHLPVYQPGRPVQEVARELGLSARRVIKMASNENPLGPSPAALAALKKALNDLHQYPDGNAFYLKQKLAAKLGVTPAHLVLGNGSNDIIEFLGHALLGPGDEMVVSQYCFVVYPIVAKLLGARVITVPARDYGHDLPAMLRAVSFNTKLVFVANPNNPTGTLAPAADVRRLVAERGLLRVPGPTVGFAAAHSRRTKTQPHPLAHVFQDLRPGRFAPRLWHRASGVYCRAGENPAAVQRQFPGAGGRAGGVG